MRLGLRQIGGCSRASAASPVVEGHQSRYHSLLRPKTVFMKYCQAFVVLPGGYGTIDELSGALTLVVADRQDHPVPRSCWPAAPADRACLTDCARRCRPRRHLRQRAGPVHRGPTAPGTSSRSSPGPAPRRASPRPAATAPDSTPRIFGQANESSQECERAGWLANPGRAAGACWQPSVARRARPGLAPAWPGGRHPRTGISFRCATSLMWPKGTDAV